MLARADFHLLGLDNKIEIDMPAMPKLGELDFNFLLEALANDRSVLLTLSTPSDKEETLAGQPVKLQITANKWVVEVQSVSNNAPLKIGVGQIRKVVALSGDIEES